MFKKILIIILVLLVAILLFYRKPLFQEGNPLPVLSGIIKLNLFSENIVKITEDESKYITKNKNGMHSIIQFMEEKGYKLADQMGSGYIFEKEDKSTMTITHRYYSTFYDIWYFPKQ
jgi:hypothetical protein